MNVRRGAEILAIVAVVVMMGGFFAHGRVRPASSFGQAITATWYCAGKAVDERADPYLTEPLRGCELRHSNVRAYPWVEPAPLPGYALAGFAALARLPFDVARTLWFYLLVAAVVATAVLLARITGVPTLLVLLALAMVDGFANLYYGELPPLAVLALTAAAALGTSRRYAAAAVCASLAMIEPHVGLPACLAMFVWWPRTRIAFAGAALALGALSIAAIGVAANVEYFARVLPVHAAAEIAARDQYSLTRLLHIAGVSDALALRAGGISYLAMTALGVIVARRLATAFESPALIVTLPPALALFGGAFVHDLQMAAALPAAVILASSSRASAWLRTVALVALVFPWEGGLRNHEIALVGLGAAVAAGAIGLRAWQPVRRYAGAALIALACAMLALTIGRVPARPVGPATMLAPAATAPGDLASANWAASVSRDRSYTTPDLRDVAEKIPVWFGLAGLVALGLASFESVPRAVAGRRRRALKPIAGVRTALTSPSQEP